MQEQTRDSLVARFERFARDSAKQDSPFYERLSKHVANDHELLTIAAHASREPIPNVFFGAVHYLLLKGSNHELCEYYPSITAQPRTDDALFRAFSDFCSHSREELIALVTSRLVQTNEVNRCAILAPAFSVVYESGNRQPAALVEIGASAGLNLLWDSYRISYSDGSILGDPESNVHLQCENQGAPLPTSRPRIADRVGIDLNPIDLHDSDERLWLRALVWPDHRQRADCLDAAVALALRSAPKLVCGDALTVLPGILANVPRQWTLCVYHSSVLYQFSSDEGDQLASLLANTSIERPVWQVSAESEEGLKLFSYREGRMVDERFAAAFDAHGRWLCWEP
jgi:hypothetical protein